MTKDHKPSDFGRKNGYKSDLEIAETGPMVKSVNTSFGSRNHNAFIHRKDGTHEHFFYSPESGISGWHGYNWETRNNHPNPQSLGQAQSNSQGGQPMERNSFLESLKADKATIDRCNEVSRNAAQHTTSQSAKRGDIDNGGRERGDSGPGSLGRESGHKSGDATAHSSSGHSSSGQGSGGHGAGGQGAGGQGAGGHGGHSK